MRNYLKKYLTLIVFSNHQVVLLSILTILLIANLLFKYIDIIIFYTVLCVASVTIFIHKKIFSEVIELFSSFSRVLRYAIALFFIFGIISSAFAISPSIGFKGVSVTFLQFCVLFIAVYIRDNSKAVRFFYTIILLSLIFFGGSFTIIFS